MKENLFKWTALALMSLAVAQASTARAGDKKYEAGVHLTTLKLKDLGESPGGFGGRFTLNLTGHLALDMEANYFPENPSGNFGQAQGLFGIKLGKRFNRIGLHVRARTGWIHFGGDFHAARNLGIRDRPLLDLGGVLEYYPSERTSMRLDLGDTVVFFGGDPVDSGFGPRPLGTSHNLQVGIGFLFRF